MALCAVAATKMDDEVILFHFFLASKCFEFRNGGWERSNFKSWIKKIQLLRHLRKRIVQFCMEIEYIKSVLCWQRDVMCFGIYLFIILIFVIFVVAIFPHRHRFIVAAVVLEFYFRLKNTFFTLQKSLPIFSSSMSSEWV